MDFYTNNRKHLLNDLVTWYDRENHVNPTTPASSKRINNRLVVPNGIGA